MKKLSTALACLMMLTNAPYATAAIQLAATPKVPYKGQDYVGKIVAAIYDVEHADQTANILIVTASDDQNNQSQLPGLTIKIDAKDLPFGYTLTNAVGKRIAVSFSNAKYDIRSISVITNQYWKNDVSN